MCGMLTNLKELRGHRVICEGDRRLENVHCLVRHVDAVEEEGLLEETWGNLAPTYLIKAQDLSDFRDEA